MARVDRRAAWLPVEHAEARTTMARSISACAPSFPSWKLPSLPSFHARRLFPWNTRVRTRNIPTPAAPLAPPHATLRLCSPLHLRSFCLRSLELPKNQDAHRREHDFPLCGCFLALTATPTRRMNGHRPRGSNHGTLLEIYVIRLARVVVRFEIHYRRR